ncbi:hypothetical protein ACQPUZ_03420 [Clostridium tertium]
MLKLSIIEELRDKGIIELIECDKSEKDNNIDIVRDIKTNKYYKISQNQEEIKIEILAKCLKYLYSISIVSACFLVIFIIGIILNLAI